MRNLGVKALAAVACTAVTSAAVLAGSTIDGTRVGDAYGAAHALQTVNTEFGDEDGIGGDNGSELDGAYGTIESGRLNLMLTGNLEGNFNKMHILIDSRAGGTASFPALPGNDRAGVLAGMQFDAGFVPDYHVIARRGFRFDLDFASLSTGTFSSYFDVMGGGATQGTGSTGTGVNASPIVIGMNNSNSAGVVGGSAAANQVAAGAVDSGYEMAIELADLGYTSGDIKVMVFITGGDHRYLSNQFLGGLPAPQGNLGSDGNGNYIGAGTIGQNFNFDNYAGDQCFIVPEPASLSLLALAGLMAIRRR